MRIKKVSQTTATQAQVVDGYSTSTTDSYSCNYVNGITGKILWTNPDPSASSFSAQTITLSSDDYDCYEIIYMFSTTNTNCASTGKIPKGKGTMLVFIINVTGIHGNTTRDVNYSSDTQLAFATTMDESGGTYSDNRCIPLYVIGYKTGLFD